MLQNTPKLADDAYRCDDCGRHVLTLPLAWAQALADMTPAIRTALLAAVALRNGDWTVLFTYWQKMEEALDSIPGPDEGRLYALAESNGGQYCYRHAPEA
jgi:hypothetical protein